MTNYFWGCSIVYLEGKINRKAIHRRKILGSMFKKKKSHSHDTPYKQELLQEKKQ